MNLKPSETNQREGGLIDKIKDYNVNQTETNYFQPKGHWNNQWRSNKLINTNSTNPQPFTSTPSNNLYNWSFFNKITPNNQVNSSNTPYKIFENLPPLMLPLLTVDKLLLHHKDPLNHPTPQYEHHINAIRHGIDSYNAFIGKLLHLIKVR